MSETGKAVFLSYASQDIEAAKRICESLRQAGVEVWFDQSELVGGDAWDTKIRKQIAECALFVPVISATTQARREGYFRLEWKLAAQRTQAISDDTPFLLPVVIDDTRDTEARVPTEFRAVQWTRLRRAYGGQARLDSAVDGGQAGLGFVVERGQVLDDPEVGAFCARVRELLGRGSSTVSPVAARSPDPQLSLRESRSRSWLGRAVIGLGVVVVVALALWQPWRKNIPRTSPDKAADVMPNDKAVAVLPFANLSGDQAQEYFSDGLTEEILNVLARERDLRVPGRTSSFSFKGKNISTAEIAKALNVTRLVEGSVRRDGRRVRISVSLTRAADGFSEELGTFTEEVADIFALYDKIAHVVVEKVAGRTTTVAAAVPTKNPEAYDAYLQGRAIAARSNANFAQAATYYERAVELDPAFALAWSGLAVARFAPYTGAQDRSPEVAAASRKAIDRALALQSDLPEALGARANWERHVNGDYTAVRRDLARAESLQPPTAELRILQTWLERDLGNWDKAYRHAREALALDPQNGGNAFGLALSLYAERGDYLEADRLAARATAISGVRDSQTYLPIHLRLIWRGPEAALRLLERTPERYSGFDRANFLLMLGRIAEVREIVEAAERDGSFQQKLDSAVRDRTPENALMWQFGIGRPEAARRAAERILASAQQEIGRGNRAPSVRDAFICAEIALDHREAALTALGDWRREVQKWPNAFQRIANFNWRAAKLHGSLAQADEAVALLQEYFAAGLQPPLNLRFDPSFAPIRQDPRFQKLVEQQAAWTKAQPDPVDL
jgi:TolB-like protein/Tfp pilus assembly protein PilF